MNNEHSHTEDNSIIKIALNLTAACFLSGVIISSTYAFTAPIAAQEAIKLKNQAMKELVASAETFTPVEGKQDWYMAIKDGKVIAYVVPTESKGYGGTIKMVAAISPEGRALDYKILFHNETPGLGDKAAHDKFRKQFFGKAAEDLEVVKIPNEKNIQALTGATITTRAVTKGIKEAVEQVSTHIASKK
ncbi:FMN-binding protein [Dendrosporobacter sp. 1207_IL3150]|uniref:FMN-binding protein n=1 Tax=Dendrosporobacter sp. 1207_IL3150 TaxID=3084054 RepID=UPI002FD8B1EF